MGACNAKEARPVAESSTKKRLKFESKRLKSKDESSTKKSTNDFGRKKCSDDFTKGIYSRKFADDSKGKSVISDNPERRNINDDSKRKSIIDDDPKRTTIKDRPFRRKSRRKSGEDATRRKSGTLSSRQKSTNEDPLSRKKPREDSAKRSYDHDSTREGCSPYSATFADCESATDEKDLRNRKSGEKTLKSEPSRTSERPPQKSKSIDTQKQKSGDFAADRSMSGEQMDEQQRRMLEQQASTAALRKLALLTRGNSAKADANNKSQTLENSHLKRKNDEKQKVDEEILALKNQGKRTKRNKHSAYDLHSLIDNSEWTNVQATENSITDTTNLNASVGTVPSSSVGTVSCTVKAFQGNGQNNYNDALGTTYSGANNAYVATPHGVPTQTVFGKDGRRDEQKRVSKELDHDDIVVASNLEANREETSPQCDGKIAGHWASIIKSPSIITNIDGTPESSIHSFNVAQSPEFSGRSPGFSGREGSPSGEDFVLMGSCTSSNSSWNASYNKGVIVHYQRPEYAYAETKQEEIKQVVLEVENAHQSGGSSPSTDKSTTSLCGVSPVEAIGGVSPVEAIGGIRPMKLPTRTTLPIDTTARIIAEPAITDPTMTDRTTAGILRISESMLLDSESVLGESDAMLQENAALLQQAMSRDNEVRTRRNGSVLRGNGSMIRTNGSILGGSILRGSTIRASSGSKKLSIDTRNVQTFSPDQTAIEIQMERQASNEIREATAAIVPNAAFPATAGTRFGSPSIETRFGALVDGVKCGSYSNKGRSSVQWRSSTQNTRSSTQSRNSGGSPHSAKILSTAFTEIIEKMASKTTKSEDSESDLSDLEE